MNENQKLAPDTMTVIIRDDAPLIFCQDAPSYRSVRIKLTQVQREALMLKSNGVSGGSRVWEEISRVIIESPRDQSAVLPAQAERLEREAVWLASNVRDGECPPIPEEDRCPDWYKIDECRYDCASCWREAASKAVEKQCQK